MAERLFSDLASRVATIAHGCAQPVLVTHIRNAAIEVCEKTLAYKYAQAEMDLVAGTYSYNYVPADSTEAHAILQADVNNTPLVPKTLEWLSGALPNWPTTDADYRSAPQYIAHIGADAFAVAPTPDAATTYSVHMLLALKPLRISTGLEKAVLDELEDAVVHGALQHLLTLPDQPWTNLELAAYHAKQFVYKVSERRARATVGAGRAALMVRPVPWA